MPFMLLVLPATVLAALVAAVTPSPATLPFQNPDLPAEERITDLISRLTLEEKIDCMAGRASVPRLGVVGSPHIEGYHGVAQGGPSNWGRRNPTATTQFPQAYGLGATWDPDLVRKVAAQEAQEARYLFQSPKYQRADLIVRAPNADIARDPRWGRIIEGAGEDPFLGSAVAAAQVRGLQGDAIGTPERVIAGPKHFAGYGAAIGGRDYDEVNLSDAELWNVYFPPFVAALQAGAGNVMTAYMDLNGIPATGNRWLYTDDLRGTFGFRGFVVSDANAVRNLVTHGFAADLTDAGARAVSVGIDMEMAMSDLPMPICPRRSERARPPRRPWTPVWRGCWRPSSGWACSTTRTSTRTGLATCSPIPRIGRWPASPRSDRRCCCATRATCCRWTRAASDRSR